MKQQQCALENAAIQKAKEVQRLHLNLTDIKAKIECTNKRLIELQQWNDEKKRALQELLSKIKEKETELVTVKESGMQKLLKVDQTTDMINRKLIAATAEVADRKAERERAAMALRELKAANDAEAYRFQTEVKELSDQRDKLMCLVEEASKKLAENVSTSRKLETDVMAKTNRLAELEAEVETLEREERFMRSVMVMKRIIGETEVTMLQELMAVKNIKLELVQNELDEKKRTLTSLVPSGH